MRKYIVVIISVLCISLVLSSLVYKSSATGLDIISNPDAYKASTDSNDGAKEIGNIIVWLVRTVGESIAVIMLLIIGIKYILRKC